MVNVNGGIMKKYLYLFSAIIVFLGTACSKDMKNGTEPSEGWVELKLVKTWIPEGITGLNMSMCSGYKNGEIYYVSASNDGFRIIFKDIYGKDVRTIEIPMGKGPGEAVQNTGVVIDDGKIFFSDIALGRISVFDMEGKFLDSYDTGSELGMVLHLNISDGILYYNGFDKYKIAAYDIKNGVMNAGIPLENMPEDGERLSGGPIVVDKDRDVVIMGHTSIPYSYTEYDMNLNEIRTVGKKDRHGDKEGVWLIRPNTILMNGEFAIGTMALQGKYVLAPNKTGGVEFASDLSVAESITIDGVINVFDKLSGRYLFAMSHDGLKNINGGIQILGADEKYITLIVYASDDGLKSLLQDPGEEPAGILVAVFENPLN